MKKAIVFDNSGTLIERYRVIKDVTSDKFITNINSLNLIDSSDSLALVVLQFNSNRLLELDSDTLMSDAIRKFEIEFDVSFSNFKVSHEDISQCILNDKSCVVSDITDGFEILKKKVPNMELCNGSALIVDLDLGMIAYTITSAGQLFGNVLKTVEILKSRGIDLFIVSGDRNGAILKLTEILGIDSSRGHGTVSTRGKCEFVSSLQADGYKVMMVGDGLNDILAFSRADVSVLTIEQAEEVSPKLLGRTDHVISDILEVTEIEF